MCKKEIVEQPVSEIEEVEEQPIQEIVEEPVKYLRKKDWATRLLISPKAVGLTISLLRISGKI